MKDLNFINYMVAHALIGVLPISIGSFVFFRNPKLLLYKVFLAYNACISWWGICTVLMQRADSAEVALIWDQLELMAIVFIPTTFLHFTLVFLHQSTPQKKIIISAYAISCLFAIANFTPLMAAGISQKNYVKYFTDPGTLYPFFLAFFTVVMIVALIFSYKAYRNEPNPTRKRVNLWFLIAAIIATVGGSGNFFVPYNVFVPILIPYGSYGIMIYALMTGYLIVCHRLLDIEIIIKKTLVFAGLLTMVMGIIAIITAVSQGALGGLLHLGTKTSMILSGLIIIFLYEPTRKVLENITDRYLFQKRTQIKDILRNLSKRVITIVDLDQIARTILSSLSETLRFASGILLLHDKTVQNYRILDHCGIPSTNLFNAIQKLGNNVEIMKYFEDENEIVNIEQMEESFSKTSAAVCEWLGIVDGRLCIPLQVDSSYFGLLVLGKKKSDQEYSNEEIDYFPTIASQTALAIRNALLFETVLREKESKLKAQHEARTINYARTLGHEIKNVLVTLQGRAFEIQSYRRDDLKYAYSQKDDKFFEEICEQLKEDGTTIFEHAEKIKVIASTAQGALKSDEVSLEEIYFKILWENAKRESGIGSDRCVYESNISEKPELFMVYGNPVLLQRVFVNLITNAYEAMSGQADKKIILSCEYRIIESKFVSYFKFKDTGPGIPSEIQGKIFLQEFSTKPKPESTNINASGHGQGLYVCKQTIEEFHKGKIWIESDGDKGATFCFWIPRKPEKKQ